MVMLCVISVCLYVRMITHNNQLCEEGRKKKLVFWQTQVYNAETVSDSGGVVVVV